MTHTEVDDAMDYLGQTWPAQRDRFTGAQLNQWRQAFFARDLEQCIEVLNDLAKRQRFRPDPSLFCDAYRGFERQAEPTVIDLPEPEECAPMPEWFPRLGKKARVSD